MSSSWTNFGAARSQRDARGGRLDDVRGRVESFPYAAARRALLAWYRVHGRRFPWRDEPTPYRVWVSEIMLQQTTTQTVLGYFDRFLTRFPDPKALASASEEEVLALWEGLGYYRRARALREAAIIITERFGGAVPEGYDDMVSLPGVGRYCAGAILSFGFDKRSAILEANTQRLHSRLIALDAEPTTGAAQKLLWQAAENWLPQESSRARKGIYRDVNGALTDLGRLVCQPTEPRCDECPLAKFCNAYDRSLQNAIPILKKKPAPILRTDVAFWISRGDLKGSRVPSSPGFPESPTDVLIMRRPPWALWSGLWDFPRLEVIDPRYQQGDAWRSDPELADRLALFMETEVGAPADAYRPGAPLKVFRHSVTQYRVTLSLCRLQNADATLAPPAERTLFDLTPPPSQITSPPERLAPSPDAKRLQNKPLALEWLWLPISELKNRPLSSVGRKIATFIEKSRDDATE